MGEKKKLGNFVKNSLTTCNLITIYREEFYDTKDFATIIKISWFKVWENLEQVFFVKTLSRSFNFLLSFVDYLKTYPCTVCTLLQPIFQKKKLYNPLSKPLFRMILISSYLSLFHKNTLRFSAKSLSCFCRTNVIIY